MAGNNGSSNSRSNVFKIALIVLGVVAAIFIILYLLPSSCDSDELIKLRAEKAARDSTAKALLVEDSLLAKKAKLDSLTRKEMHRDSVLNYILENCCPKKKAPVQAKAPKASPPPPPPPPPVTKYVAPPVTDFSPPSREQLYDTNLGVTNVVGVMDGDFFTTISGDGYLVHAISRRLWPNGNLRLNSETGLEFKQEGDFWLARTNTLVTEAMLVKGYYLIWSIYAGDDPGYPVWLPHEVIKPDILNARGRLDGNITLEDVKKIGQTLTEVAAGRIIPNQIRKTNEGYALNDEKYYEGWSFKTLILYRSK